MFIIIGGPTAIGKTDVAIDLAKKINGEIISADSMQIYKYMDIGTYKVSKENLKNIKHYMIDIVLPYENFSVAQFKKKAEKYMDDIKKRKKIPIIVGGTGLYIHSIIRGLFDTKEPIEDIRRWLRKMEKEKGKKYLYSILNEKDPETAKEIDKNNPRRIIRALEIILANNRKLSEIKKETEKTIYKDTYKFFILNMNRKMLYDRINNRVLYMIKSGLEEEVKKLLNMGLNENNTSMQAIGYKEMVEYINRKITLEEAIRKIQKNTRNYAKRQITWFKKYKEAIWIDVTGKRKDIIVEEIMRYL